MKKKERPVIVTTEFKGIFFGYATDTSKDVIHLKRARNCIRFYGIKGFVALADTGPGNDCRVGPPADMELRKITAVLECTPEAEKAWNKEPWG